MGGPRLQKIFILPLKLVVLWCYELDGFESLQEKLIEKLRKVAENELKAREAEIYRLKERYKEVIKSRYEEAVEEFTKLLGGEKGANSG